MMATYNMQREKNTKTFVVRKKTFVVMWIETEFGTFRKMTKVFKTYEEAADFVEDSVFSSKMMIVEKLVVSTTYTNIVS